MMVKNENLSWFPVGRAITLKQLEDEEFDVDDKISEIYGLLKNSKAKMVRMIENKKSDF